MGPSLGCLPLAGAELGVAVRCDPSWGSDVLPSGSGTGGELIAFSGHNSPGLGQPKPPGFGHLRSQRVKRSISCSTPQALRISTEGPQQARLPAKYSGKPKKSFACMIFFFFENETDSAGGLERAVLLQ